MSAVQHVLSASSLAIVLSLEQTCTCANRDVECGDRGALGRAELRTARQGGLAGASFAAPLQPWRSVFCSSHSQPLRDHTDSQQCVLPWAPA